MRWPLFVACLSLLTPTAGCSPETGQPKEAAREAPRPEPKRPDFVGLYGIGLVPEEGKTAQGQICAVSTKNREEQLCVDMASDGTYALEVPPGLYELCGPPDGRAASPEPREGSGPRSRPRPKEYAEGRDAFRPHCSWCRPRVGDEAIRADLYVVERDRLPLKQGFRGQTTAGGEGPTWPVVERVCAAPPDARRETPVAELICTIADACGRYALEVPEGRYRLHFADVDGERTHTYDGCEFDVGKGTVIERDLQSGFGQFWWGDKCEQPTEVYPPQPSDIEPGTNRCRSCTGETDRCEYALKFQCNAESRGDDDCSMPVACDPACCDWPESREVPMEQGPWKRVVAKSRKASAPKTALLTFTYSSAHAVFPDADERVLVLQGAPNASIRWKDGGRRLLIGDSDPALDVDLKTGTVTPAPLGEPEPDPYGRPTVFWSPDGSRSRVSTDERERRWLSTDSPDRTDSEPVQTTAAHPDLRFPTWHPTGEWLVYWRRTETGRWRITIGTPDGTTYSDLGVTARLPGPIAVSHDGLHIAYVRKEEGLYIAALATPDQPIRVIEPQRPIRLSWAPPAATKHLRRIAEGGAIEVDEG